MNKVTLLAIDIAKNVFQLHGVDEKRTPILKRKPTRNKLSEFIVKFPLCTIVMEACGGENYWARKFKTIGHEVKLISPQFVKPFVKTNKSDRNGAETICEKDKFLRWGRVRIRKNCTLRKIYVLKNAGY